MEVDGWPVDDAVRQALGVLSPADPASVIEARLVLFGRASYETALHVRAASR